jgi:hypothetical protein
MKFFETDTGILIVCMHVRTILYVLSKVQRLFDLRRIRKATILYTKDGTASG